MLMWNLNGKSQPNLKNDVSSIDISNFEQGKINLPYSQINHLSKVLKINKKYLTTCLYFRQGTKLIGIPVNDKKFNYEYFRNLNSNSTTKAKLYVQKYTYENKEYLVAVRIE